MFTFGSATTVGGIVLGIPEAAIAGMLMAAVCAVTGFYTLLLAVYESLHPPVIALQRIIGASLPAVFFVGDDVPVDVVLRPHRRTSAAELVETALDELAIRRGARSVRLAVRPLRAGKSTTAHYRVTLRQRGTLRFLPAEWRRLDPLGLFWLTRRLDRGGELFVAPAIVELSPDAICTLQALRPIGGRSRHATPDPFSLRDLRPHVPGEDLRRVHWATSARRNTLTVREPDLASAEQIKPLALLVDARTSSHDNSLELALSIAASVVVALDNTDGPFEAHLLTDDGVAVTSSVTETLLALAGVERQPTRGTRGRGAPAQRSPSNLDVGSPTVALVITGPFSDGWRPHDAGRPDGSDVGEAGSDVGWAGRVEPLVLRAGVAPLDALAWGPGAPTREALRDALSACLARHLTTASAAPTPTTTPVAAPTAGNRR